MPRLSLRNGQRRPLLEVENKLLLFDDAMTDGGSLILLFHSHMCAI